MPGKRKGNPNWGKRNVPFKFEGVERCEFDRVVAHLGLNESNMARSRKLRDWAQKHKDTRYVPEPLLEQWGLTVRLEDRKPWN